MYYKSIVLSGAPCAGKTLAQKALYEHFRKLGFEVHLIREVASMIHQSGIHFKQMPPDRIPELQRNILLIQRDLEKRFEALSQLSERPVLLISDRGGMDALAYMEEAFRHTVLQQEGLSLTELRDGRYDAVFHLVTSALGAPEAFRQATHAFRNESPDEAIRIDDIQLRLWTGHPHLRVFDNQCTFPEKIAKVIRAAEHLVGIPEPIEFERKFLVKDMAPEDIPMPSCTVDIEQYYLGDDAGNFWRIRKRGQDEAWIYTLTRKADIAPGKRMETEEKITAEAFDYHLNHPGHQILGQIVKKRTCFVYESRYYELDRFVQPKTGFTLLECETDEEGAHVPFPPFLQLIREVTGDPDYDNNRIAAFK